MVAVGCDLTVLVTLTLDLDNLTVTYKTCRSELMPSWLDRLQKDAHQHEMEPSNTSPVFFLLLAIGQAVVVQIVPHHRSAIP